MSWRDLLTEDPVIPPDKLASPTLGAVRRQHDHGDEMCEEARVLLALELIYEARRLLLLERLDGVMQFLAAGAEPDQAMRRLRQLVDDRQEAAA